MIQTHPCTTCSSNTISVCTRSRVHAARFEAYMSGLTPGSHMYGAGMLHNTHIPDIVVVVGVGSIALLQLWCFSLYCAFPRAVMFFVICFSRSSLTLECAASLLPSTRTTLWAKLWSFPDRKIPLVVIRPSAADRAVGYPVFKDAYAGQGRSRVASQYQQVIHCRSSICHLSIHIVVHANHQRAFLHPLCLMVDERLVASQALENEK